MRDDMVWLIDWPAGQSMETLEHLGATERTPPWGDLCRGYRGSSPFVAIALEVEPLDH